MRGLGLMMHTAQAPRAPTLPGSAGPMDSVSAPPYQSASPAPPRAYAAGPAHSAGAGEWSWTGVLAGARTLGGQWRSLSG